MSVKRREKAKWEAQFEALLHESEGQKNENRLLVSIQLGFTKLWVGFFVLFVCFLQFE